MEVFVLKEWSIIKEKDPELGLFVNISTCELIYESDLMIVLNNLNKK